MPRLTSKRLDQIIEKRLRPTWRHHVWRTLEAIALIVGIAAFGFAGYAIKQANDSLDLAKTALAEQRSATAWQILSQPGTYGGKRTAIELLTKTGDPIIGLDLSCDAILGADERTGRCLYDHGLTGTIIAPEHKAEKRVQLMNLNLSYARLDTLRIERAAITFGVFSNARLESMKVQQTQFVDVTLAGAKLHGSVFTNGTLFANANFDNAELGLATFNDVTFREYVNFQDAELIDAKFKNISFEDTEEFAHINISGAEFCFQKDPGGISLNCPIVVPQNVADRMWYWSDNPPKGLNHEQLASLKFKRCPGTDLANRKPKIGSRTISLAGINDRLLSFERFWPGYFPMPQNCAVPMHN